jgi:hypothetical protein
MWFPNEMKIAPTLDEQCQTSAPKKNYALLIIRKARIDAYPRTDVYRGCNTLELGDLLLG